MKRYIRERLKATEKEREEARKIIKARLIKMNEQTKERRRLKKLGLVGDKNILYPSQERDI